MVEWLSINHPAELADLVSEYDGADPVMTATQQIGKAIEKCGEVKIGTRESDRVLEVGGVARHGRCQVAVWRI